MCAYICMEYPGRIYRKLLKMNVSGENWGLGTKDARLTFHYILFDILNFFFYNLYYLVLKALNL